MHQFGSSFAFAGAKNLRQKCLHAFILISNSARSVLIQCAEDVLKHGHVSRNLANVELRFSFLEPHLGLRNPEGRKLQ
ncbi:hypothetical protein T4D_15553 [Trichinella pseudospiralis]|uniref:Uncharacterized protein n=1 Tax=Trichinella pseudospiralis TaxID=6337 RepID=A0A0V1G3Z8_TRIPS|nr:hypothetical protein T4D_15553 [Trichinella pseudospiralis]